MNTLRSMNTHDYVKLWVGAGALSGALISGFRKCNSIMEEPKTEYKNEIIEPPVTMVYHTCRVASHAGLGAFIAGATAATAPVFIPLYVFWYNK